MSQEDKAIYFLNQLIELILVSGQESGHDGLISRTYHQETVIDSFIETLTTREKDPN